MSSMQCPMEHEDDLFDDKIDLTPLIDTVFLLLIFFIMATTFSRPVMDVLLPSAASATQPEKKEWLILTIDEQGAVFHDGNHLDRDDIVTLLANEKERPVSFQVDKRSAFERFAELMDLARLHGRSEIVIMTSGESAHESP